MIWLPIVVALILWAMVVRSLAGVEECGGGDGLLSKLTNSQR